MNSGCKCVNQFDWKAAEEDSTFAIRCQQMSCHTAVEHMPDLAIPVSLDPAVPVLLDLHVRVLLDLAIQVLLVSTIHWCIDASVTWHQVVGGKGIFKLQVGNVLRRSRAELAQQIVRR